MEEIAGSCLNNAPAPGGDACVDRQRAALHDLLDLRVEPVRLAEQQIEQDFAKGRQRIEHRHEHAVQRLQGCYENLRERIEGRHREQLSTIESNFQRDSAAIEVERKSALERIVGEVDSVLRGARHTFDQDTWLAESVAEATKGQLRKEGKQIKALIPQLQARLGGLRDRARWVFERLGYTPAATEVSAPVSGDQPAEALPTDPRKVFEHWFEAAREQLFALEMLRLPRLLAGAGAYVMGGAACLAVTGAVAAASLGGYLRWPPLPVAVGLTMVVTVVAAFAAGRLLRRMAARQVVGLGLQIEHALHEAGAAIDLYAEAAMEQLHRREEAAVHKRDAETRAAGEQLEFTTIEIERRRESSLKKIAEACERMTAEITQTRETELACTEAEYQQRLPSLERRFARYRTLRQGWYARRTAEAQRTHDVARANLESKWRDSVGRIGRMLDDLRRLDHRLFAEWGDPWWKTWSPPREFTSIIRFGAMQIDLTQMAEHVRRSPTLGVEGLAELSIPALMSFPDHASLLLQTDRQGRIEAIEALQAVMTRLLVTLPAGRVHFTIADPVGLGENFAGFMHLADHDEAMVGGRIWTEGAHIEQRLADLTTHMEHVIQKYLRNEFETIEAYNAQAGELAEPYRFLVVADFPVNFTEESLRRLSSIITSGPRCGVYTLIAHDRRQNLPAAFQMEDLEHSSIHLVHREGRFVWQDPVFRRFPLVLDAPPPEEMLTRLMHDVGRAARESKRVEVPFDVIAPTADELWTLDSSRDLQVPVGRSGAVRLQYARLGRGVAQHMLIAGKTGSGKSTLLHVLVTNLAMWYAPDEVEFYLIDFKKGVEFKTYATHELPHARVVAIESDREFGLSVLHKLDAEMERRGELFRKAGVQDLAAYRAAAGVRLPRALLIVDEFQIFFSDDDKLAQDAAIVLDRLVRQGRAFGIHVVLGSQTLGGMAGLARSTVGQMAVRIALQCTETDSQLILADDNTAARLLGRPGEAIYNDAGGRVEGNSPFQTAWLADERRDAYLQRVTTMAKEKGVTPAPPIVFEGNVAADLRRNRLLGDLLIERDWSRVPAVPRLWLGEPVAIKNPTAAMIRRQSGANVVLVGQRDDAALALMAAGMVSLAAQHRPGSAKFIVLDGTPADSSWAGQLARVAAALPIESRLVEWRDVEQTMAELAAELRRRQELDSRDGPAIYVIVNGLQRYRMLRRREDDFGFSRGEADAPVSPDRVFADLLREGPPLGMHVIAWSDTAAALERTFDRASMREFDNRVLFQMSATDSSNLIDSPAANTLGFYRALFYSEEQGVLEKFRPYAPPELAWVEQVGKHLAARPQ